MAVGPDVHQAHEEDTERYVLTNLNMVSAPQGRRAWGVLGDLWTLAHTGSWLVVSVSGWLIW